MSTAVLLIEATFAPSYGRTFYLVGKVRTGKLRVGMTLLLPHLKGTRIDCTIRTVEPASEPEATCVGIRYCGVHERLVLLGLDLNGCSVLVA